MIRLPTFFRLSSAALRCLGAMASIALIAVDLTAASPPSDAQADRIPEPLRSSDRARPRSVIENETGDSQSTIAPLIRFSAEPYFSKAIQPQRRLRLVNGDVLTAEILADSGQALDLRLFGAERIRVSKRTIAGIFAMPGERELLNEDLADTFTANDLLTIEADGLRRLRLPTATGDFRCWFRFRLSEDTSQTKIASEWNWRFDDDQRLSVTADRLGRWRADLTNAPLRESTHQVLNVSATWHLCTLQRLGTRLSLAIDNNLLWAGPAPTARLNSLEFSPTREQAAALRVEHISFVEIAQNSTHISGEAQSADAIFGLGGETWWGELKSVGPRGAEWSDGQKLWQRGWGQMNGVMHQTPTEPLVGPRLVGCVARIELQPAAERLDVPGDAFTAVVGESHSGWLTVDHPLWGRFAIPHAALRTVAPQFLGDRILLDGREIRLNQSAQADGSSWDAKSNRIEGRFELTAADAGLVDFSLEASGLEPAGPETPPGSPTLKDLRQGRLATELFVNGQRVGSLNELTSLWTLPGEFERLRIRLPREVLRTGQNTWRIEQQPSGRTRNFDDCVLRNCSLEIRPAWP